MAEPTQYVVLVREEALDGGWEIATVVEATGHDRAVRRYLELRKSDTPALACAVPARSWNPVAIEKRVTEQLLLTPLTEPLT
jgi:hypothetical protein